MKEIEYKEKYGLLEETDTKKMFNEPESEARKVVKSDKNVDADAEKQRVIDKALESDKKVKDDWKEKDYRKEKVFRHKFNAAYFDDL